VDDADISAWAPSEDYSVRIILAMIAACQKEPALNAWYDQQQSARRLFKEIHMGLAMDTPEGLFVPVIENAQDKSPQELRKAIEELKVAVHNRTIAPERLQPGSIVLSNFGKFAGRYATPVVVPPTVAIIGVGALRQAPCVHEGELTVGRILPLSLTFDHRAVTGGEATRFLGYIMEALRKV
jgi:pyruvate dehydrogenase E2 component (dihydrolipoamide acetyltransferase)